MSKKIIDLASGSITDSGLTYIGDPLTGTLNRLSYKQVKDYALSGITSYDPTQLNLFSQSILTYTSSNDTFINFLFDTTVNLWQFTSSIQTQVDNTFSSQSNYLPTLSFQNFTSSYYIDSASFVNIINNVFASESKYLLTSSFNTFSSSYVVDSASFLSKITNAGSTISNIDGTLTISPISGSVTASLNLGHANTWTGQQTFNTSAPVFSTMTSGSVLFAGANGVLSQDNANFFWDNTNKSLGIGTTTPNAGLFGSSLTVASGIGIISAYRKANSVGFGTGFPVMLQNSLGNPIIYSYQNGQIVSNTAGSERGALQYAIMSNGTLINSMMINYTGNVSIGLNPVDDGVNRLQVSGSTIIIQNGAGATQPVGLSFTNNTSASATVQQNPGYISFTGQGWKTTATAGSQPWSVNLAANAAIGTANALPQFAIGYSANGVGLGNWMVATSTALTFASLGTITLTNNGGPHMLCQGNRTIFQNAQQWLEGRVAIHNGGAYDPTAYLDIGAGSVNPNTAPIKFRAGAVMATPEVGSVEYNGTNLFLTRSGSVRENVMTTPLVSVVSPTSPDRTIKVNIDGVDYYISAKTSND